MARRRRRRKQLLDDLKENRRYWNLKEEGLVMSREQTAGPSHTLKVDNSSIERVKESNIWERR